MQTELLLTFAKNYNIKEEPNLDDFYHFLGYLNVIKEEDVTKMFSGLGYIKRQHKAYISWLYWFLNEENYNQIKKFCSENLRFEITEIKLEEDTVIENLDIDLVNKSKYISIENYIQPKPNHITYVSSYFQADQMQKMYEKIHKIAKEQEIVVDIIFQSTLQEEQGDFRMPLYERFATFFDSLIYFKPTLFFIHTGWTYCRITDEMYKVFTNLKKFKSNLQFVTDTKNLFQESFLPPNNNIYYNYDAITNQRTEINSLGKQIKQLNFESYNKSKNEIFSVENELSLTFKSILKNV